ncbi:MAG: sulfatase-like hydrolase/transferase [Oscillospiraceae bacterium]|nr:sulfatase-like hydrolase/transferase [Oscillospiraceae bacterium]
MDKNQIAEILNHQSVSSQILQTLFFPASALYYELLLRIFDLKYTPFISIGLVRVVLFSLAAGLLVSLVLNLIPAKKLSRILGAVILVLCTVIFCIERGCRSMFGLYFGLATVSTMTGAAVGGFASTVWAGFLNIIPFFILSLIPAAVFIVFRKVIISDKKHDNIIHISTGAGVVICHAAAVLLSLMGGAKNYFTYDFTANNAVSNFGLVSSMQMELVYSVIGMPQADLGSYVEKPPILLGNSEVNAQTQPNENSDVPEPPKEYGFNIMDIDFGALAAGETDKTLKSMHEYFGSLTPSQQNEYTGLFAGKNLIFITAEAFSPYFISEELTPTLYRLTHEGFVFKNYYQPDWTQSTVGGEIANTTGIIPTWIDGKWASVVAAKDYMPFALGNQFAALGYNTPAWHNHLYSYYGRNKYLTAFGYDYKGGQGGGLVIPNAYSWPESDLEMMQATVDSYTDDYVNNKTPFHAYYMTVSGHAEYSFIGNAMASKNKKAAQAAYPDASEAVQAYIACNLELEYAMKYLVDKLEEKGIADDTVIVLAADHYPYGLMTENEDYYNELRGFEDTELVTSRYRNALIMWSASIEEPIIVDTPCSSIDILPTISNLFGLEYDSRLMIGRDIFAQNYEPNQYSSCMPLVILINNHGQGTSWITAAGVYEASSGIFTPNEGITVDDDYISRVKHLVEGKINYSKLLLSKNYYEVIFGAG